MTKKISRTGRKFLALTMALALCLALGIPAMASETSISYTHTPDPSYTITIPARIELARDGTDVAIEASDVANLGGKKISVTVAGTDDFMNQFVLKADTSPLTSIRYGLTLADGTYLETTGTKNQQVGKELASFTDNGVVSYRMAPIIKADTVIGASYSGTLTYGIELI